MKIDQLGLANHRSEIVDLWVEASDTKRLLESWQITQEEFASRYANGIFDHLLAVLEGRQPAGDCPTLLILLEYLASKNVSVGDIFTLCMRFRHSIGIVLFKHYFLGEPCSNYQRVIREVHAFFDLNLRGALDYYYETLQKKEQEIKKLTQKNELQESLIATQNRQAIMGEMISAIAHQWRQPLNVLSIECSNIDSILDEAPNIDTNEIKASVESIKTHTNYMNQTIKDFRNFFKPQGDDESFLLSDAVNTVLNLIKKQYTGHGIQLEINSDLNREAKGRKSEVVQLLLIILSNAKDAIVQNSKNERKITLDLIDDNDRIKLCIEDSGGGIDSKILANLFTPYTTSKPDGTGIGLYIAKQIAQKNSGDLEVTNNTNGAKFCLILSRSI